MKPFLCLLTIVSLVPLLAHAGPTSKLLSCTTAFVEKYYLKLVATPEDQLFMVHDTAHDNRPVYLALKEKLGAGFFGAVVHVDFIADPELDAQIRTHNGVKFSGGIVAKLPHAVKHVNLGKPLFFTQAESVREAQGYTNGVKAIPAIEKAPGYPKEPAWNKGEMPVVPIITTLNTERGLLIFKPELSGKGLKQIAREFVANHEVLPEAYEQGLHDIYDFVQAAYVGLEGQATDIRPPNLMWVEEPGLLEFLGYSRPGFVLFELSKVPGNIPQYINGKGLSFEQYRAEYISYLKRALASEE